ncbi:MAG: DNA double-strand break repair nuclease NurA [Nitrososphaerota archaeon]
MGAQPELDGYPDWSRMPKVLQTRFFELAEAEAQKLIQANIINADLIKKLKSMLKIRRLESYEGWEELLVACVDGSDTPVCNERIGLRYALFASAYKLFKGLDGLEEEFISDYYSDRQIIPHDKFSKIVELFMTYYERLMAQRVLKKYSPDILLLDGSFFGYRTRCSEILDEEIDWIPFGKDTGFKTGRELVKEVTKLTIELIESGRALGVIKRVNTASIDGWFAYKDPTSKPIHLNDRTLLNMIMEARTLFSYDEAFSVNFNILNWYRNVSKESKGKDPETILNETIRRLEVQIKADLGDKSYLQYIIDMKRCYIKTMDDYPPVCVEFWKGSDPEWVKKALWYVYASRDPATGLPFPLDIVDSLVSLPKSVAKEFAEEVEARLLRVGVEQSVLLTLFSRFNPQKEE